MIQEEPGTGHRLVIGSLGEQGFVLDDVTGSKRLGLLGYLDYFGIMVGGRLNVLLAGVDALAEDVTLDWGSETERCIPRESAWMSSLRPFVLGLQVRVDWHHGDGHLRFTTLGPMTEEQVLTGSDWTFYAPL